MLVLALGACDRLLLDKHPFEPPDTSCTKDFCIDVTEVTREAYAEFLAEKGDDVSGQSASCVTNTTYVPSDNWPPSGRDLRPVVNVDWCDGAAYCAWKGRRLCGRIGGGSIPTSEILSAAKDQWYHACTGGIDGKAYPYGDTYVPGICSDTGNVLHEVKDHPECVGGLPGVYDLSGNVWEWTDACDSDAPNSDCTIRGGAFYEPEKSVTCGSWSRLQHPRVGAGAHFTGFRCCSDLE